VIEETTDTRSLICDKTQRPAIHDGLILHLGKCGRSNWMPSRQLLMKDAT